MTKPGNDNSDWVDEDTVDLVHEHRMGMILASALIACAILVLGAVVSIVVNGRAEEAARDAGAQR